MYKSLRTDLVREIRHSLPRFLSILLMVALGVMFLVGLRSAAPDMRATADRFFDEQKLFDVQVYSTVGLDAKDLEALSALEGAEACVGGQSLDGTLTVGDVQKVVKLLSLTPGFNTPVLTEGRLPEAPDECLLDAGAIQGPLARVGSTVHLHAALDGALVGADFRVVGLAQSPLYISIDRGTSTLGDGSVACFVLLPEEAFALDYWSVIYLRAAGAAEADAYSPAYEALTAELTARAESGTAERAAARYEFLKTDGAAQLARGERELKVNRNRVRRELAEGERKLSEARTRLDEGWAQLEQGKQDYKTGLQEGQAALEQARTQLAQGRQELALGEAQLTAGRAELTMLQTMLDQSLEDAKAAVPQAEQKLQSKRVRLAEARERARAAEDAATQYEAALRDNLAAALTPGREPDPSLSLDGLAAALAQAALETAVADAAERDVARAETELADAQAAVEQTRRDNAARLAEARAELAAGEAALREGRAGIAAGEAALAAGEAEYETKAREGQEALDAAEAELNAGETDYAAGLTALEENRQAAETALAEARETLDRAAKRLETLRPPQTYVLDRHSNYGFVSYDQNAQRMANLAHMFPIIFYLVAALVCLTTMTRMVEEERTQIGAVKAMGYGTAAIAGKYLIYGALAALLGAVLGAAVGSVLIPWVIFISYKIMYVLPRLELRIYWPLCLTAGGAGLAVTLGATAWAMGSTARQSPAVLLRPKAPKPGKRILLERVGPLWRRMSFSVKVSARNLFRYKKRLFMTVIGVAGCTGLLIAGLGLHSSIFDILDVQFFDLYRYDVMLTLDADSPGAAERVEALLRERDDLSAWTGFYSRSVNFRGDGQSVEGYLIATDEPEALEQQIVLRDMDSKQPLKIPARGAIIDLKLSELLDRGTGSELEVDLGRPVSLEVAAVREHYVYHYAFLTGESYRALTGESPAPNEYLISLKDPTPEAVSELCTRFMRVEGVNSAQNKSAMANSFRKTMKVVDSAVMVIVLSAAALAFVVLYNLTNINVTERIRELATIKVLGFYDPEVAMYIYRENLVLTLLGIALGQLFGKYLCAFLIRTIEMNIVMFGRDPQVENYLLSVVLSLAFAALVNLLMFFRIRRIDMVQALKSVE